LESEVKILFSPSEGKTIKQEFSPINKDSFIFPELYEKREVILKEYDKYIHSLNDEELNQFFGIKNGCEYVVNIFKELTCKAIERYDGVAYDYLEYSLLDETSQKYIDENTLIFSNLFGVIKANDKLPFYRMKQGKNLPNIEIDRYYKKEFSLALDEYLADEVVLDLRAGHYYKFYKPKNYITMKFIKNGKVVSHWAKAYRGIILKEMAKNKIETEKDLLNLQIDKLTLIEIQETKSKITILYEIKD
jgi:cytoplasmic iron level regulating protein YaaA (DUF328/UPF0246 family)